MKKENFVGLVNEMITTYNNKNHDYGNSFDETIDEFGLIAAVVRMNDKMKRIKSLYNKPSEAKVDESLCDTLMDLANYCIMTALYIKNKE